MRHSYTKRLKTKSQGITSRKKERRNSSSVRQSRIQFKNCYTEKGILY